MSQDPPSSPATSFEPSLTGLVDYARSLDCIHCGLCLRTCPTYRLSGRESASPRGRIHLMRAAAEGRLEPDAEFREEMDFCLVCRHCESACPAGVEFGAMMEYTRAGLMESTPPGWPARVARKIGFGLVLRRRWAIRLAGAGLWLGQRTGLVALLAPLFGARGRALSAQPAVPPWKERGAMDARLPADGEATESALILTGCVMPEFFGRVNRATATVLNAVGCEVHTRPDHVCCGALHAHNGDLEGARDLARSTIASFESPSGSEPQPVVVNSAGCGAHMKEYERLLEDDPKWRERATAFSARVVDFAEYVAEPERKARLAARLAGQQGAAYLSPLTYDDPCHLCHGQGVRSQPRELLSLVEGIEAVEMSEPESCCGSAGIYSVLRPEDSNAVLDEKLEQLRATGARTLVTGNPGCHMQWQSGVTRTGGEERVLHIAEVLEQALRL